MATSMMIVKEKAPELVQLVKKTKSVMMTKPALIGHAARVYQVYDRSGSAKGFYQGNPSVMQQAGERTLAVSTQFDDNASIDIVGFHTKAWYAGELTLDNYRGGIDRLLGRSDWGYTDYAAAIYEVMVHAGLAKKKMFGGGLELVRQKVEFPVYVDFLTDGQPYTLHGNAVREAEEAIRFASQAAMFINFVGIGNGPFELLSGLDNLSGRWRNLDNTGFYHMKNPGAMSDEEILENQLGQYAQWVPLAREYELIG